MAKGRTLQFNCTNYMYLGNNIRIMNLQLISRRLLYVPDIADSNKKDV